MFIESQFLFSTKLSNNPYLKKEFGYKVLKILQFSALMVYSHAAVILCLLLQQQQQQQQQKKNFSYKLKQLFQ